MFDGNLRYNMLNLDYKYIQKEVTYFFDNKKDNNQVGTANMHM